MAKNNTEVKPLTQDGTEKTLRAKTQLELKELTAELNSIKEETTNLKKDIQQLKINKDNDKKREKVEVQSLELRPEQEKQTGIRMESTVNELQQKILKLETEKGKVIDEIRSATFQTKMFVTKIQKEMLLLKAQKESLSKKHKELEHILSAQESAMNEKSSEVTEKRHKSEIQEAEKLRAICNELKFQFKEGEDIQKVQGRKQAERETVRFNYVTKVYGKESQPKPAKLNKLTEIEKEILKSANVVNQQL